MNAVDGAPEIDVHFLDMLIARLIHEKAVDGPANVVDQDVHTSQAVDSLGHHVDGAGLVGHICVDDDSGSPGFERSNLGGDSLAGGVV